VLTGSGVVVMGVVSSLGLLQLPPLLPDSSTWRRHVLVLLPVPV